MLQITLYVDCMTFERGISVWFDTIFARVLLESSKFVLLPFLHLVSILEFSPVTLYKLKERKLKQNKTFYKIIT